MISAKDAREIVFKNIPSNIQGELDIIEQEILKAAAHGKSTCGHVFQNSEYAKTIGNVLSDKKFDYSYTVDYIDITW